MASVILAVVTFAVGLVLPSPWEKAQMNASATPVVTAEVVEHTFPATSPRLSGVVHLGRSAVVSPTGAGSSAQSVITNTPARAGSTITPSDVVVEISGRPVVFLRMPFPLYRDLHVGDQGRDVAALQRALADIDLYGGAVDGRFGSGTQAAVARLYATINVSAPLEEAAAAGSPVDASPAGVASPEGPNGTSGDARSGNAATRTWLPMQEVLAADFPTLTLVSVAPVGTTLGEQTPQAAQLRGGSPTVEARVGIADKALFEVGQAVRLASAGDSSRALSGEVVKVGDFVAGSDSEVAGHDVVFSATDAGDGWRDDEPVFVTRAGESTEARPVLAVPMTALREDDEGTFVMLVETGKAQARRRLPVTLGAQAEGWAEVTGGDVVLGQRVLVAGG